MPTKGKNEPDGFGLSNAILIQGGIFGVFSFAGGLVEISRSQPPFFLIPLLILLFFLIAASFRVRLIVGPDGIFVRKLVGSWQANYSEITEVFFGSLSSASSPIGLPIFNLQTTTGLREINLRLFSDEACATLFNALEEKGKKIRKINTMMCRWMVKDIRHEQRKIKARKRMAVKEGIQE